MRPPARFRGAQTRRSIEDIREYNGRQNAARLDDDDRRKGRLANVTKTPLLLCGASKMEDGPVPMHAHACVFACFACLRMRFCMLGRRASTRLVERFFSSPTKRTVWAHHRCCERNLLSSCLHKTLPYKRHRHGRHTASTSQ